jgi:hypothetical protein
MKFQITDLIKIPSLILIYLMLISLPSCVDQVDAEYAYQDNIIFIDAYALTQIGTSSVSISRSNWDERNYSIKPVEGASVKLENINAGFSVDFIADSTGVYLGPANFAVVPEETWVLHIELADGRKFESQPETVKSPIPIDDIKAEYSPEVVFNEARNSFVPGHLISIDWQDPEAEENYYLWKYRTFEPLFVCKTCFDGRLRNGECEDLPNRFGPDYYNYLCDPACWQIKYEEEPIIFEDRLFDGSSIENKEIVILPFFRRPNILIEVQQLSIDKSTYNYFKILSDQVSASGGLNAPPAAPLLGNIFNPDDPSEIVLGNFTAAGVSSKSIFIDRSPLLELPIRPDDNLILETCIPCPTSYPCMETFNRTSVEPTGWQ